MCRHSYQLCKKTAVYFVNVFEQNENVVNYSGKYKNTPWEYLLCCRETFTYCPGTTYMSILENKMSDDVTVQNRILKS